jgi:hypothetical protein
VSSLLRIFEESSGRYDTGTGRDVGRRSFVHWKSRVLGWTFEWGGIDDTAVLVVMDVLLNVRFT